MKSAFMVAMSTLLSVVIFFTNATPASAASIAWTRFSISGWNGPLYLDFNGQCRYSNVFSSAGDQYSRTNQNGTWRVFLYRIPANVTHTVSITCGDYPNTDAGARYWEYQVRYGSGKISAIRTHVSN